VEEAVKAGVFTEINNSVDITALSPGALDSMVTGVERGRIVIGGVPFFINSSTKNTANVNIQTNGFQAADGSIVAKGAEVVQLNSDIVRGGPLETGTQMFLILSGKDSGKVFVWTPGLTKFGELKTVEELGDLQVDIDKQQKLKDEGNFTLVP